MFKNKGRRMASTMVLLALPLTVLADGVAIRYDLSDPAGSPFPSDRFTVADPGQNTGLRVQLPQPDCKVRRSDCEDIDVLNTLDGFSTQPRITIPFNGDIDPLTVTSQTVFLMTLGDAQSGAGAGQKVGINQVVWDPASKTLAFESDQLLQEHMRYVLIVTDGVRDATGKKIKTVDLDADTSERQRETSQYRRALRDALRSRIPAHLKVAAASLFTTQSASADLYKIMQSVKAARPTANFMLGNQGKVRTVFPVEGTSITLNRQVGAAPSFATSQLPMAALQLVPGAVGRIAYGSFSSPSYLNKAQYIPATPTLTGQPEVQRNQDLVFQLFLPSRPMPAGGYPVAIFGHGFTDSMYGAPWTVASTFAAKGIATLAIQVVGHGGGDRGTLTVTGAAGSVTLPAGGRGYDQDGNGSIDATEGVNAVAPYTVLGSRDGLRQTVVDLMQLVSMVNAGVDVDADGKVDLDPNRIYYAGQSFGGIYGTILLGLEPRIRAGVPNVPGGSITEVARLGAFRGLTGFALATRVPSLINLPAGGISFNENIPLRNLQPVTNDVPGAMAIQQVLDRNEWAQQPGNPVSYAPYIRANPLPGNSPKPVLIQFARGDQTVPNPTSSAIVRAGGLADVAVEFRNDVAHKANPAVPKNPHTFLTNISVPAAAPHAVAAQRQIAEFFDSDGSRIVDPDGTGALFEVPSNDLPETLNFIP